MIDFSSQSPIPSKSPIPNSEMIIRRASILDARIIAQQRREMFIDMGDDPKQIVLMDEYFYDWVRRNLASKMYRGWIMEDTNGNVVAGVGLWIRNRIPTPTAPEGRSVHIVNMYVTPEYRRRQIARQMIVHVIRWCYDAGFPQVTLETSKVAKRLYDEMGFVTDNHMTLRFKKSQH